MSFDIFLQAFERGAAADRDGAAVRDLILSCAQVYAPEHSFARVVRAGGEADVYGVPGPSEPLRGLMFNHVAVNAYDLIVEVAIAADLVVMPVGCRTCVVHEEQIGHLPEELRAGGVEIVRDGADLIAVVDEGD